MPELLRIEKLNVGYGDVQVLWDIDFSINSGEIVALVGPNGAGKTTLLSTISGLIRASSGQIMLDSKSIIELSPQAIVGMGIVHVPEGRRLFGNMSVRDNLLMGAYLRRDNAEIAADLEKTLTIFPRLKDRLTSLAEKLSGGEQQMVAIGRALMTRPRLLIIDELSLGLAPMIVQQLVEILAQVNREGMTVMLVEQDIQVALEIANRGYVLEAGTIKFSGSAQALLNDEHVKRVYLGLE